MNEKNRHLSTTSPLALDLLNGLLCYDHEERLTAREALNHPYFAPLRKEEEEEEEDAE